LTVPPAVARRAVGIAPYGVWAALTLPYPFLGTRRGELSPAYK